MIRFVSKHQRVILITTSINYPSCLASQRKKRKIRISCPCRLVGGTKHLIVTGIIDRVTSVLAEIPCHLMDTILVVPTCMPTLERRFNRRHIKQIPAECLHAPGLRFARENLLGIDPLKCEHLGERL